MDSSTKIIACSNLEYETILEMKKLNINLDIIWLNSKLHGKPDNLREELQDEIDNIDNDESLNNLDEILILFGSCGNSVVGLKSEKFKLICLNMDDCFAMFLGGNEAKRLDKGSYYYTKKYLEDGGSIYEEYNRCIEKYGEKKSKRIFKSMFNEYNSIKVIDTGAYDINDILDTTTTLAFNLQLDHTIVDGYTHVIAKALKKEYDDDFIIKAPGEQISIYDFMK